MAISGTSLSTTWLWHECILPYHFVLTHDIIFVKRRVDELVHISALEARQRWLRVHEKFHYCGPEEPGAVTMDKKIFFRNIRDLNKYGKELRVATTKLFNVAVKKRLFLMTSALHKWSVMMSACREHELRVSHITQFPAEKDETADKIDRAKFIERTRRIHRDLMLTHTSAPEGEEEHVDADPSDDSRRHFNSLPMAMHRRREEEGSEPPPWHPSVGFLDWKLPELPVIPVIVAENITHEKSTLSDKQKYNSFRAAMEGPTDYSCWIIPGRLAMGRIPIGKARSKGPVDSVIHNHIDSLSQLILAGLNSFVSLVTEGEEQEATKSDTSLAIDPSISMKDRVRHCHRAVQFSLKEDLLTMSQMVEEKNIQLEDYSHIEDGSHLSAASEKKRKIDQLKKEKNRIRAKKLMLSHQVDMIRAAVKALPSDVDWIAFPLEHNSVPSLDCIIPILWKLEQKLWEGECIYVYSKDGNGRSGLICECDGYVFAHIQIIYQCRCCRCLSLGSIVRSITF